MISLEKRLQVAEYLTKLKLERENRPLATLTFRDGTQQSLPWMDAFLLIGNGADVVCVEHPRETERTLLEAMMLVDNSEKLPEVE